MTSALVIGAGPAGLMAADILSQDGVRVTVTDKMPSFGRKFQMAGKSGLNLTKAEPLDVFQTAYFPNDPTIAGAIADFGPDALQAWAHALGQETFVGSTGRVFPTVMKASPLLREWLAKLRAQDVTLLTRHIWQGWDDGVAQFDTADGAIGIDSDVTILALGGASWSRLGSDGAWAQHITQTVPFQPANVGFLRTWSPFMAKHIGQPIKGIALIAGELSSRGEIVLSREGIEGGGVYEVSRTVRDGHPLHIDLVPDLSTETLRDRWSRKRAKGTLSQFLKSNLRLSPIKIALWHEITKTMQAQDGTDVLHLIKSLPITHNGPRPIDQAISTAGGVDMKSLTKDLMLRDRPGVFCAGEMLDWEAPTGGYLITGCLATGRLAALGAMRWMDQTNP